MKNTILLLYSIMLSAAISAQTCFEADASIWENTWASCSTSQNPKVEYGQTHWIQYDLGSVRKLSRSWIWNTNDPDELDRGFRDVKIDYSLDGNEWTHWGEMQFPQGMGTAVYGGFPGPDMLGIEARYVLLTATSNYGDASCAGLAEVKFNLLPNAEGAPEDGLYENCAAITDIEVEVVAEDAVLLLWEAEDSEQLYIVEYRLTGTSEWLTALGEDDAAYIENLIPLETYEYRVMTVCQTQLSEPTIGIFTLDGSGSCPYIEQVIIDWVGTTEAFLWWTVDGEATYEYILTLFPEDDPSTQMEIPVNEPELLLEALLPSTTYKFFVTIICEAETRITGTATFTTRAEGEEACKTVEDISLDELGAITATFSWEAPAEDLTYVVTYTIDNEEEEEWTTVETTATQIQLQDLQANTPYILTVGVRCGEDILWSEAFFFDTETVVSTIDPAVVPSKLRVFPNPTRGLLAAEFWSTKAGLVQYQLISSLGQVVQTGNWSYVSGRQQYQLDLSRLPDGVYHLQLLRDRRKLVKSMRVVKVY